MNARRSCEIFSAPDAADRLARVENPCYNGAIVPSTPTKSRSREAQHIIYSLRALGERDLPESIEIEGKKYSRETEIKHDFFAATGFYLSDDESKSRVVLKMSRSADFCGLPLIWLGRWLCNREMRFYRTLSD